MKKAHAKIFASAFLIFFAAIASYGQSQAGDVWLMPESSKVAIGQRFEVSVHLNTGAQNLAAYGLTLTYNTAFVICYGKTNGPDGFLTATSSGDNQGTVKLNGFDTVGKGPSQNLNLAIMTFEAQAAGTAVLNLSIESIVDSTITSLPVPQATIITRINVIDPSISYGDVDSNGRIDIIDALNVARYYVGLIQTLVAPIASDVTGEGSIDIVDALTIARYYVGSISELPIIAGLTKKNTEIVPVYPNGIPPLALDIYNRNLSVKLRDAKGAPLPGKTVEFYGEYNLDAVTAVTDANGIATAEAPVPGESTTGYSTEIVASFKGDSGYAQSASAIKISVAPTPPMAAYNLPPSYVSIQLSGSPAGMLAEVSVTLPDTCHLVTSWGPVQRSGNTFTVDTVTAVLLDTVCLTVLVSATHDYDLGALSPGNYVFNFRNLGTLLLSVPFTVSN